MSNRRRAVLIVVSVILLAIVPLGRAMMFTVNEREVAVVLQFGKPVASYTEPNLYFKIPFVQEVRRLPKTYQFWAGAGGDILVGLPTADGKKLEVTPWAVWRITDPKRFVEVLRTVENADSRVRTFVRSAVRDAITSHELIEAIRSTNRELTYSFQVELDELDDVPALDDSSAVAPEDQPPQAALIASPDAGKPITIGREKIVAKIKEAVRRKLAEAGKETDEGQGELFGRGIELVDVGISRIDFVPMVREAAFQRLIAFMESIAARHSNEGERRKQEIINRTEAEVQKILGEGLQQANITKGKGEAEIIDAYAEAIRETGDFYNFIRTLEAYEASLTKNTRLIMTTDSGLLRLLQEMTPAGETTPAE